MRSAHPLSDIDFHSVCLQNGEKTNRKWGCNEDHAPEAKAWQGKKNAAAAPGSRGMAALSVTAARSNLSRHFLLYAHVRRADCLPRFSRAKGNFGKPMGRLKAFCAFCSISGCLENSRQHPFHHALFPGHLSLGRGAGADDERGAQPSLQKNGANDYLCPAFHLHGGCMLNDYAVFKQKQRRNQSRVGRAGGGTHRFYDAGIHVPLHCGLVGRVAIHRLEHDYLHVRLGGRAGGNAGGRADRRRKPASDYLVYEPSHHHAHHYHNADSQLRKLAFSGL